MLPRPLHPSHPQPTTPWHHPVPLTRTHIRRARGQVMTNLRLISDHIESELLKTGHFEILSKKVGVPLVAFRLLPTPPGGKKR